MTFTAEELRLLRASDRIVDQQEPGGLLDRQDRLAARAAKAAAQPNPTARTPRTNP